MSGYVSTERARSVLLNLGRLSGAMRTKMSIEAMKYERHLVSEVAREMGEQKPSSREKEAYLVVARYTALPEEADKKQVVEAMREIAEILIWGDQNDQAVFDFFIEKNLFGHFLKIMRIKGNVYVKIQLLQCLNIIFENLRNDSSLYFFMSNNHVNQIISHEYDFANEEILAYYMTFLKTLSLRLSPSTIYFFHNEHQKDFPLFTEAVRFYNHKDSHVRIAVRTITLNIYKVQDAATRAFVCDPERTPYLANLVWHIGKLSLDLDQAAASAATNGTGRVEGLLAEYLDNLYYLHDVFCAGVEALNDQLTALLLDSMLVPLYVYSLAPPHLATSNRPRLSAPTALLLLAQVFTVLGHKPLIATLVNDLLKGGDSEEVLRSIKTPMPPPSDQAASTVPDVENEGPGDSSNTDTPTPIQKTVSPRTKLITKQFVAPSTIIVTPGSEEAKVNVSTESLPAEEASEPDGIVPERIFRDSVLRTLEVGETDRGALAALLLVHAVIECRDVDQSLLQAARWLPKATLSSGLGPSAELIDRLLALLEAACQPASRVRLATADVAAELLVKLCFVEDESIQPLKPRTLKRLQAVARQSQEALKAACAETDLDTFMDMFEEEYYRHRVTPPRSLMMDPSALIDPVSCPMPGAQFARRLPVGEVEKLKGEIAVYLLLRRLAHKLARQADEALPLLELPNVPVLGEETELAGQPVMPCKMVTPAHPLGVPRLLLIDAERLILVEPQPSVPGRGYLRLAEDAHHVIATHDSGNPRILAVVIDARHIPGRVRSVFRLVFGDHLRAAAALYVAMLVAMVTTLLLFHCPPWQNLQYASGELQKQKQVKMQRCYGILRLRLGHHFEAMFYIMTHTHVWSMIFCNKTTFWLQLDIVKYHSAVSANRKSVLNRSRASLLKPVMIVKRIINVLVYITHQHIGDNFAEVHVFA